MSKFYIHAPNMFGRTKEFKNKELAFAYALGYMKAKNLYQVDIIDKSANETFIIFNESYSCFECTQKVYNGKVNEYVKSVDVYNIYVSGNNYKVSEVALYNGKDCFKVCY